MFLAQNLKYLREENKMSQQELSDAFGWSRDVVDMLEKGSRKPDIEMAVCISRYFDRSLDELVLKDIRPPEPKYADNMAYLRTSNKMSLDEMGNLLRVNGSTVLKYELKEYPVDVEKLMKVADFFGITLEQLVNRDLSKEMEGITENQRKSE